MPANLSSILSEQHSVILMMLTRAGRAPHDKDAVCRLLYAARAHLRVVSDVLVPLMPANNDTTKIREAAQLVLDQLSKFMDQPVPLHAWGDLARNLGLLFVAEAEALRRMLEQKIAVAQSDITRAEDAFQSSGFGSLA